MKSVVSRYCIACHPSDHPAYGGNHTKVNISMAQFKAWITNCRSEEFVKAHFRGLIQNFDKLYECKKIE